MTDGSVAGVSVFSGFVSGGFVSEGCVSGGSVDGCVVAGGSVSFGSVCLGVSVSSLLLGTVAAGCVASVGSEDSLACVLSGTEGSAVSSAPPVSAGAVVAVVWLDVGGNVGSPMVSVGLPAVQADRKIQSPRIRARDFFM